MSTRPAPFTVVSFHAHPDDEALLTAGTLALAARAGHRVVIVVATAGEAGLADQKSATRLAQRRRDELEQSAATIGAARVEIFGYADTGFPAAVPESPSHSPIAFSRAHVPTAAAELARLLREEDADVLTIYDPAGGYGHPDHIQVHRVGLLAATLANTPVVLEATLDRQALARGLRVLHLLSRFARLPQIPDLSRAYTDSKQLTHRIDVRPVLDIKRNAMRAHTSQTTGDDGVRTLTLLLRIPRPFAKLVLGYEWFRELGRESETPLLDDIFATLS